MEISNETALLKLHVPLDITIIILQFLPLKCECKATVDDEMCNNCYKFYCTYCNRGCDCVWRYMDNATVAANKIIKSFFSPYTCEHTEDYGMPNCGARVSRRLFSKLIIHGDEFHGIKCIKHVCQCQYGNEFDFDTCEECHNRMCIKCFYGCVCL